MRDKCLVQLFWAGYGWVNLPEEFKDMQSALLAAKSLSKENDYKDVRLVEVIYNYYEVVD